MSPSTISRGRDPPDLCLGQTWQNKADYANSLTKAIVRQLPLGRGFGLKISMPSNGNVHWRQQVLIL